MKLKRKLRMGMVGGGQGAFIGAVHRTAAQMDGLIELVAGCFSSDAETSLLSGKDLFLREDRIYSNFREMVLKEASLPAGDRIDFVSIVTPNHMHYPVAEAFLRAGIHVICDKPVTFNLKEARNLRQLVKKTGLVFALTHNYTGYPLVKEARAMIRKGKLGTVLKVVAEYPQGWLLHAIEKGDHKQASWRTDPKRAGVSCCVADIGTHAENLCRYITGLEVESVLAEFTTFVPGRKLEDDANMLVRFKGGAKGILYASQISAGEENGPYIRIYGTKASLEWRQPEPNQLLIKYPDRPTEILRTGNAYLSKHARSACRLPAGHPEAFLEAFANIYHEAGKAIADAVSGRKPGTYDFPGIVDGVHGMAFIESCVKSARLSQWVRLPRV